MGQYKTYSSPQRVCEAQVFLLIFNNLLDPLPLSDERTPLTYSGTPRKISPGTLLSVIADSFSGSLSDSFFLT